MNYFTGKSFFHTRIKPERERKNDEKRIPGRKKRNHWTKHTQYHVKEILIRETESECFERLHGVVKLLSWAILCAIVRAELENQFAGQTRKSEAERFWGGEATALQQSYMRWCELWHFGIFSPFAFTIAITAHTNTAFSVHALCCRLFLVLLDSRERAKARARTFSCLSHHKPLSHCDLFCYADFFLSFCALVPPCRSVSHSANEIFRQQQRRVAAAAHITQCVSTEYTHSHILAENWGQKCNR